MTILVTGTIDFDPAKRDDAIAAVTACMAATRAEEGNEGYVFSGDLEDEGRFHVTRALGLAGGHRRPHDARPTWPP